jgi:hypothetical protein
MARPRNIAPGFFRNEDLSECSPLARLLFAGLWCWADREGRLEDRPKRLKAEILPYDKGDGDTLVAELEGRGLVARYEAAGVKVLEIVNFHKYQRPHPKETPSLLPARDGSNTDPTDQGSAQGEPKDNPGTDEGEPGTDQGSAQGASFRAIPSRSLDPREASSTSTRGRAREAAPPKLPSKAQHLAEAYPATQAVLDALPPEVPVDHATDATTRTKVEKVLAQLELAVAVAAVTAGYAVKGKLYIGWYLDDLAAIARGASPPTPELDEAWLATLPAEARAEWRVFVDGRLKAFWPDRRAQALAEVKAIIIDKFTSPPVPDAPF